MRKEGPAQLAVYQRALDLVEAVYRFTKLLPDDERFGMVAQMRRAAVSIVSNIAEGYGRQHRGDYVRFVSIARGSVFELEAQSVVAGRLGLAESSEVAGLLEAIEPVRRMLTRLIESLSEPASARPSNLGRPS